MRRLHPAALVAALALVVPTWACGDASTAPEARAARGGIPGPDAAATHTYSVRIENLTTSQPFSPGVIVTHTGHASVWAVGEVASEGIREIAENGNEVPAIEELEAAGTEGGIFDVVSTLGDPPPIGRIGGPAAIPTSRTFTIQAAANFNRLSVAVMLICTNDGFTGLEGVKLPRGLGETRTFYAAAYDAGTEENNELYSQIVDPCGGIGPVAAAPDGNGRVATPGGVIAPHPGIQGDGDLSAALHGWEDPVAKLSVTRTG